MGCGYCSFWDRAAGRKRWINWSAPFRETRSTSRYGTFLERAWERMAANGEAEELLRQTMDLDPNFLWTYYFLAELYTARRMFAEALFLPLKRPFLWRPGTRRVSALMPGCWFGWASHIRERTGSEAGFRRPPMEHR